MKSPHRVFSWHQTAKALGITLRTLLTRLHDDDILLPGEPTPRQRYIDDGYFFIEHNKEIRLDGRVHKRYQVARVTIQGLAWLERKFQPNAAKAA